MRLRSFGLTVVLFGVLGPLLGMLPLYVIPLLFSSTPVEGGWPVVIYMFFYALLGVFGLPILAGSLFVGFTIAVHDAVYDETRGVLAVILAAIGGVVANGALYILVRHLPPPWFAAELFTICFVTSLLFWRFTR